MKTIYMGITVDLIQQEQLLDHIEHINTSGATVKETKDGIKYLVIKSE